MSFYYIWKESNSKPTKRTNTWCQYFEVNSKIVEQLERRPPHWWGLYIWPESYPATIPVISVQACSPLNRHNQHPPQRFLKIFSYLFFFFLIKIGHQWLLPMQAWSLTKGKYKHWRRNSWSIETQKVLHFWVTRMQHRRMLHGNFKSLQSSCRGLFSHLVLDSSTKLVYTKSCNQGTKFV